MFVRLQMLSIQRKNWKQRFEFLFKVAASIKCLQDLGQYGLLYVSGMEIEFLSVCKHIFSIIRF